MMNSFEGVLQRDPLLSSRLSRLAARDAGALVRRWHAFESWNSCKETTQNDKITSVVSFFLSIGYLQTNLSEREREREGERVRVSERERERASESE